MTTSLPIDEALPALLAALATHNAVVLQAPPGAGKTTRVPLALCNATWLSPVADAAPRKILMLEPRRLAARAAASYMARQLGEQPGDTVGYRTRLDSKISARTTIEVVTEGILTRMLQDDPSLENYGIVIFDEFHERSLQADLGLALARESQLALRDDLRLLVMSATLDTLPVAHLLAAPDGKPAPVITSEGRQYPVETRYLAGAASTGASSAAKIFPTFSGGNSRTDFVADVIPEILERDSGSMLVFLPGVAEIRRVQNALAGRLPANVRIAPLFGDLSMAEQDAAIAPARDGERKIVLATSIAETSLTIEGVRIVVDAGWQRRPMYDAGAGMSRLVTSRVSKAAADQRRGRAGRTEPGTCWRLWPETEQLNPFSAPEISDADLAGVALELAQWGSRDPRELAWLDVPPMPAWEQGVALLRQLDALDAKGAITPHGNKLLRVGLAPRLAHLVVRGRELGLGRYAAQVAAVLSERDVLPRGAGCDLRDRLEALSEYDGRMRQVQESARRLFPREEDTHVVTTGTVGELLALAFPDRVARRRGASGHRYLLANGRGAFLPEGDALAKHEWLVCAELDGNAREAKIFLAAPVDVDAIVEALATQIRDEDFVGWDDTQGAMVARQRKMLGALALAEKLLPAPTPEQVQQAMVAVIRERGLEVLPWSDASRQFVARVRLLAGVQTDAGWPDFSASALLAALDDWAAPFLAGITRLSNLKGFPLLEALRARLDYARQRELDALAPERWEVPTGSQIAIDYTAENGPVLAVKLQEMFGATQTPVIANGSVALTLHLLSPAQRPVAVTRNLVTFWQQGYPDVRKDLRGRYPKHPWPEDPLTATPQRGVKKRPG